MIASFAFFAATLGPDNFVLRTSNDNDLVALAAQEFNQGVKFRDDAALARPRFRESARFYDELWRRGFRDPNLTLNRAISRRLAGDLPGAIVALNEGQSAARWSRPLQLALEDARSAVVYSIHSDLATQCRPATPTTIGTRMSPLEAKLIAGGLWLLACAGITRFAMTRAAWWLAFAFVGFAALCVLGGLWLQDSRVSANESEFPLVVVNEDVYLRKGNSETYPLRLDGAPKLPKGVEARELARRGGWMQIRLANGVVGWIPESTALKVGE